jgi:hypothetical protein
MWESNMVRDPDLELVRMVGSALIFQDQNSTFFCKKLYIRV